MNRVLEGFHLTGKLTDLAREHSVPPVPKISGRFAQSEKRYWPAVALRDSRAVQCHERMMRRKYFLVLYDATYRGERKQDAGTRVRSQKVPATPERVSSVFSRMPDLTGSRPSPEKHYFSDL